MKSLFFSLLGITMGLTVSATSAHADSPLETMSPTNYGMFSGVGGFYAEQGEPSWVNLLEPEQLGSLQCLPLTHTEQVRCYGYDDYHLTIIPTQANDPQRSATFEDKMVNYRIGASDDVGASIRTHPSENNPSAILELGVQFE